MRRVRAWSDSRSSPGTVFPASFEANALCSGTSMYLLLRMPVNTSRSRAFFIASPLSCFRLTLTPYPLHLSTMKELPSEQDLQLWNYAFTGAETMDLLRWCVAYFGPTLALGTGFGLSGMVLLDMLMRISRDIDVFFLDTGLLFAETYAFRRSVESHYGISIRGVRPTLSLEEQTRLMGDRLWERDPDLCCALRKVEPLATALHDRSAWLTAIRRDQSPTRRHIALFSLDKRLNVVKIAPLAFWQEADCRRYVRDHRVPVNPLHRRGYPSFGCHTCTRPVGPGESQRAGRWPGFAKTECGLHWHRGRPAPVLPLASPQVDKQP
ncbi:MAG: phosphoadenylyl-sulfate reductase [Caldilineae bacterium]|nr:MAG: phosphoadenylyl-sulfate reductase [Caldilineae bacterium]